MNNSKKKPCLLARMGFMTIEQSARIIYKRIKLNQWVELSPIYDDLRNAKLFEIETNSKMHEVFIDICEFLNYNYELNQIQIDDNLFDFVRVTTKKRKEKKQLQ